MRNTKIVRGALFVFLLSILVLGCAQKNTDSANSSEKNTSTIKIESSLSEADLDIIFQDTEVVPDLPPEVFDLDLDIDEDIDIFGMLFPTTLAVAVPIENFFSKDDLQQLVALRQKLRRQVILSEISLEDARQLYTASIQSIHAEKESIKKAEEKVSEKAKDTSAEDSFRLFLTEQQKKFLNKKKRLFNKFS